MRSNVVDANTSVLNIYEQITSLINELEREEYKYGLSRSKSKKLHLLKIQQKLYSKIKASAILDDKE